MIKVVAGRDRVKIVKIEGTMAQIMKELCCIVDAVCDACTSDEDDSEGLSRAMILTVSEALRKCNEKVEHEDDENADF